MAVIHAEKVSKTYPAHQDRGAFLGRGGLGRLFRPPVPHRPALAPMSLNIEAGEAVGIIGRNGSGKSTLLKIISGVTAPSTGSIHVTGRIASLLELGAGFHPMLSGRENIYLYAGLLGMRHAQVDAAFNDIVAFAELNDHIEDTVDTYSSGMYVRLAFSVAVHTNPDIFLVDEVLAVGDESFQRKCRERILALKAAGKTILFVSHELGTVQSLCDRLILLDKGKVLSRGTPQDTIDYYLRQTGRQDSVHRLSHGDVEVLFSHGRFTVYHREKEITAPLGAKVQILSQGTYHESTDAEWHLESMTDTHLVAVGTFPRLPVKLTYRVLLDDAGLHIATTWENTLQASLEYIAIQCAVRSAYIQWHTGLDGGDFPVIGPADSGWSAVALQQGDARACELTSAPDNPLPPLCFTMTDAPERARFQIDNGDFMNQVRVVHLTEAIPSGESPLPPQRRDLGCLSIDPNRDEAWLTTKQAARRDEQVLRSGSLVGRLHQGSVALSQRDVALSQFLHLHVQFRTADLWTASPSLQWEDTQRAKGHVFATGHSLHLPCALRWSMEATGDDALGFTVSLETSETVDLNECNLSLCLNPAYDQWQTAHESAAFGPMTETAQRWSHANQQFLAGVSLSAHGKDLPQINLSVSESIGATIPAALQSDVNHPAHIIQLLATPEAASAFTLAPGTHILFRGQVTLGRGTSQ